MLCKNCNYENDAAAKFCENCGANLQAKNPVQTNKGLRKIIWGSIALLYVGLIVCLITRFVTEGTDYVSTDWRTRDDVMSTFVVVSLFVFITAWVLFFVKQIKLSLATIVALVSSFAFVGTIWIMEEGIMPFFIVFFVAAVTTLVYKYSFAENQKLL